METKCVIALFVGLLIILAVNPRMINNIYSTILGRLVLIGVVIFLAMNNLVLGLLVALAIISSINQFGSFVEGMDTMAAPVTIGEDNVPITGQQIVLTKSATADVDAAKQKISDLKARAASGNLNTNMNANMNTNMNTNANSNGIDKEAIRNTIMAKNSKTIQLDANAMKNEDVNAYNPSMLTNTSSMTEGFCPCAASAF
jgi:hypothetical protein